MNLTLRTLLVFVTSLALIAQGPTAVQQVPSRLDAANQFSTLAAAGTLTITPNASESIYIYEIDISNCAGASAVAAAATTTITSTNITGSPIWLLGSGTTAGLCVQSFSINYPTGLKAQTPGTAVTFVLPTFATNQTVRINVTWRSAP